MKLKIMVVIYYVIQQIKYYNGYTKKLWFVVAFYDLTQDTRGIVIFAKILKKKLSYICK